MGVNVPSPTLALRSAPPSIRLSPSRARCCGDIIRTFSAFSASPIPDSLGQWDIPLLTARLTVFGVFERSCLPETS